MWLWPWQATERPAPPNFGRDRFARFLALATFIGIGAAFIASPGTQLLMPGPLSSAHGAIKNCSSCHANTGNGKLSWVHGLVASSGSTADSKACLTCHKMPDSAFNPHGASAEVLKNSTLRLVNIATRSSQPLSARAQTAAFPMQKMVAAGLNCASCHQEHQGINSSLNRISNEQCRSCHSVKFDSFDDGHPAFDTYPFRRRTRIIYDHTAHFDKHFPDVAKKDPSKQIPTTCSTCHDSQKDKRIMAVGPFERTCSGCHLGQITGKDRVNGPKGIAFLTLPGLDLETLKKNKAAIGEWPDASESELTPFMKMMIGRNAEGRATLKAVDGLNLQDLAQANGDQIKAVTDLAWDIKKLFYALIAGKASDVLGDLNIGDGRAKLSPALVADLTANIPRDVVLGAQQQWLPNLAREIADGPLPDTPAPSALDQRSGALRSAAETSSTDTSSASAEDGEQEKPRQATDNVKRDPPACLLRVFGQCIMNNTPGGSKSADNSEADSQKDSAPPANKKKAAAGLLPPMQAGLKGIRPPVDGSGSVQLGQAPTTKATGGESAVNARPKSAGKALRQSDDLLFPTDDEARDLQARNKGVADSQNNATQDTPSQSRTGSADTTAAPVISIASDVDAESWAEYGGWYRQDYAIFYRPTGHKDKFIYSWLFLTGPKAQKNGTAAATAAFNALTNKDAQGSCTKCHSIDDGRNGGRVVNFSPLTAVSKNGRFTRFIHEPHFGIVGSRGCLTCHDIAKDQPYLKSYDQGNPRKFASNFSAVKKDVCQGCHASSGVRQDCLTCHSYHVNGIITPIMTTRVPTQ
ncbi:MAG: hypothetical protein JSR78_16970 [Proteobacteria bacterium]|nr:hypothetical protein [Pseudomonadota bacterium]